MRWFAREILRPLELHAQQLLARLSALPCSEPVQPTVAGLRFEDVRGRPGRGGGRRDQRAVAHRAVADAIQHAVRAEVVEGVARRQILTQLDLLQSSQHRVSEQCDHHPKQATHHGCLRIQGREVGYE